MLKSYSFIRDRTRAIRNDFTLQNYNGPEAIECHERIARYHILCSHQLSDSPSVVIQQEHEQLRKTLQSLIEFYSDNRPKKYPNEAEFQGYYILSHLFRNEFISKAEKLSLDLFLSNEIQSSIEIQNSIQRNNDSNRLMSKSSGNLNNFNLFFELCLQATFLQCCVLHIEIPRIRSFALKSMQKSYYYRPDASFSLSEIKNIFLFSDLEQTVNFLEYHNVPFDKVSDIVKIGKISTVDSNGRVKSTSGDFIESRKKEPVKYVVEEFISKKKIGTDSFIIDGGHSTLSDVSSNVPDVNRVSSSSSSFVNGHSNTFPSSSVVSAKRSSTLISNTVANTPLSNQTQMSTPTPQQIAPISLFSNQSNHSSNQKPLFSFEQVPISTFNTSTPSIPQFSMNNMFTAKSNSQDNSMRKSNRRTLVEGPKIEHVNTIQPVKAVNIAPPPIQIQKQPEIPSQESLYYQKFKEYEAKEATRNLEKLQELQLEIKTDESIFEITNELVDNFISDSIQDEIIMQLNVGLLKIVYIDIINDLVIETVNSRMIKKPILDVYYSYMVDSLRISILKKSFDVIKKVYKNRTSNRSIKKILNNQEFKSCISNLNVSGVIITQAKQNSSIDEMSSIQKYSFNTLDIEYIANLLKSVHSGSINPDIHWRVSIDLPSPNNIDQLFSNSFLISAFAGSPSSNNILLNESISMDSFLFRILVDKKTSDFKGVSALIFQFNVGEYYDGDYWSSETRRLYSFLSKVPKFVKVPLLMINWSLNPQEFDESVYLINQV